MTYGLEGLTTLARVSYHAQELSLLTASQCRDEYKLRLVKRALDEAFHDLTKEGNDAAH